MSSKKPQDPAALRKENERSLYKRLCMVFDDLLEAHEYLARLTGSGDEVSPRADDKVLRRALRTALVVAYARPFSRNRREDGRPDALPKGFLKGLTKRQLTVHKDTLRMRDQEYAHLDAAVVEMRVSIHPPLPTGDRLVMPLWNPPRQDFSREWLAVLGTLLEHFVSAVCAEKERIEADCVSGEHF